MEFGAGAEKRVMAVLDINAAEAEMAVVQIENGHPRQLERLRKRIPKAMVDQKADPQSVTAGLKCMGEILDGFEKAARDYGAAICRASVSGYIARADGIGALVEARGIECRLLDVRERADVMMAGVMARQTQQERTHSLFIVPERNETCVVSGDGVHTYAIGMGMDSGPFDDILMDMQRSARKQLVRRNKDVLDMRALIMDAIHACTCRLPRFEPESYQLTLCIDTPQSVCPEGVFSGKQIKKMADNMARRLSAGGAVLGFLYDDEQVKGEAYHDMCARRTVNALYIANEVAQRTGLGSIRIMYASALEELTASLLGEHRLQHAGRNELLAVRRAEYFVRSRSGDTEHAAFVELAARMMINAMADEFPEGETVSAGALLHTAALLSECARSDDEQAAQGIVKVAWLPGMSARNKKRVSDICAACMTPGNDAIYDKLMPESIRQDADRARAELLFYSDNGNIDEFDYADYAENENAAPGDEAENDGEYQPGEGDDETDYDDIYDEPFIAEADSDYGSEPVKPDTAGAAAQSEAPESDAGRELAPIDMRLAAILVLAQTLDQSRRRRLGQLSIKRSQRGITLRATAQGNAVAESEAFKYRAALFEKVFGMRARLKLEKNRQPAEKPAK